ncbi:MAG TPA: 50S ribosomal protein L10 [Acidimicrobiales bacterium]|nr:50S ribosomal protein L10 [Acidimicrobiales bacterium]
MDNPRPEKVAVVDEVREHFDSSDAAILTEYRGLKVKDLATLRRALRPNGGDYKIYKNTLVTLAARESGLAELEPLLKGPTAIAFVKGDAAAVAKALRDYSRTNPTLVIKGGVLGNKIIGAPETTALAELPSREVLLAQLAGAMAAPLQQFAGLLQALPRNLAYGLAALRDQREAEGPSSAAEPAAATEPAAAAEPAAATDEAPAAADEAPAGATDEASAGATDEAPAAEAAAAPAAPAEDTPGDTETTTEPTE